MRRLLYTLFGVCLAAGCSAQTKTTPTLDIVIHQGESPPHITACKVRKMDGGSLKNYGFTYGQILTVNGAPIALADPDKVIYSYAFNQFNSREPIRLAWNDNDAEHVQKIEVLPFPEKARVSSVRDAGNVTITWTPPLHTGENAEIKVEDYGINHNALSRELENEKIQGPASSYPLKHPEVLARNQLRLSLTRSKEISDPFHQGAGRVMLEYTQ